MTTAIAEPRQSERVSPTGWFSDTVVLARRTTLHLIRTPQLIVFSIVQTLLFLLLFRYVFGGSIRIGTMSYADYIIPGFMTQIAIFDGFGIAVSFAEDAKGGIIDRFRSLPMARSAVLTGRLAGDLLRQLVLLALVVGVGYLIGFSVHTNVVSLLAALGVALVFGGALFWVFAAIGLAVRDAESAQAAATPFMLLAFVSSGFIIVDTLPGWLQPFARNQPVSMATNAIRALVQGDRATTLVSHGTGHYVLLTLLWSVVITAVFAPASVRAFRKP